MVAILTVIEGDSRGQKQVLIPIIARHARDATTVLTRIAGGWQELRLWIRLLSFPFSLSRSLEAAAVPHEVGQLLARMSAYSSGPRHQRRAVAAHDGCVQSDQELVCMDTPTETGCSVR